MQQRKESRPRQRCVNSYWFTVKPLLSSHLLLTCHLPKSWKLFLLITFKLTCIKQSPFPGSQQVIFYPLHLYLTVSLTRCTNYTSVIDNTLCMAFSGLLLPYFSHRECSRQFEVNLSLNGYFTLSPFSFSWITLRFVKPHEFGQPVLSVQ